MLKGGSLLTLLPLTSSWGCRPVLAGAALAAILTGISPDRTEAAGTLYWSPGNSLRRASTEGDCRQTILSQINAHVDVDPEMGKVYYMVGHTIKRCDFDGANVEVVYSGIAADFAIDRVNHKLYWSVTDDNDPNQIMRANLDGTDVELVIGGLPTGSAGIAVDPSGGKVYWTQEYGSKTVHRVNFDGTAHEQISVAPQVPFAITVHHASGKVFWTDLGFGVAQPGGVYRANLDFSNIEQIVSGLSDLTGMAIDEAAGMLYFCGQNVGILHCDLNGGGLVALVLELAYDVAYVPEEFGFICLGDANGDLHVDVDDIVSVILWWGRCRSCPEDFNSDGSVNVDDLTFVLNHWTP